MGGAHGEFLKELRQTLLMDPGPSGLSGRLLIGVAHPTGESWMEVHLDGESVKVSDPKGGGADVNVLVGDYEAKRILKGRGLPHKPLFSVQGDGALLARFVDRYLAGERWIAFREGVPVRRPRPRTPTGSSKPN